MPFFSFAEFDTGDSYALNDIRNHTGSILNDTIAIVDFLVDIETDLGTLNAIQNKLADIWLRQGNIEGYERNQTEDINAIRAFIRDYFPDFAASFDDLNTGLSNIETAIDDATEVLDSIDTAINGHNSVINQINASVDDVASGIEDVSSEIGEITDSITDGDSTIIDVVKEQGEVSGGYQRNMSNLVINVGSSLNFLTNITEKQAVATTNSLQSVVRAIYDSTNHGSNASIGFDSQAFSNIVAAIYGLNTRSYGIITGEDVAEDVQNMLPDDFREKYTLLPLIALFANAGLGFDTLGGQFSTIYPLLSAEYRRLFGENPRTPYQRYSDFMHQLFPDTSQGDDLKSAVNFLDKSRFAAYNTLELTKQVSSNVVPSLLLIANKFADINITNIVNVYASNGVVQVTYPDLNTDETPPSVNEPQDKDFANDPLVPIPDSTYQSRLENLTEQGEDLYTTEVPQVFEEMMDEVSHNLDDIFQNPGQIQEYEVSVPLGSFVEGSEDYTFKLNFEIPKKAKDKLDAFWTIILSASKFTINCIIFLLIWRAFFGESFSPEFNKYFDDL